MITPNHTLPGVDYKTNPTSAVSNLSSLFTVCALALSAAEDWDEPIRERVTHEIVHLLNLGALLAIDATVDVERLSKGKAEDAKGRVSQ